MRFFISIALFIAISATLTDTPRAVGAKTDKPNIVVFLVDDMGVMDTSVPFLTDAKGKAKRYPLNNFYRTPNMKRLADRGIRFNNFYAMSVCSPTRISILTGQNAARHHATNWINPDRNNRGPSGPPKWNWQGLKKSDVTLPRILAKAGYRTIHVGKGHFGAENFAGADPKNLGFDVNVGGASFGAPGSYFGEKNYLRKRRNRPFHAVPHLEKYHGSDTFLTEALTIEANKRVTDAVKAEKPFFLYFAHYAVHAPFDSDPRFAANYTKSGKSPRAQAFATLIEGMDKSLGDVLDHLDKLGVAENTIVLFLGDNGSDAPLGHQHAVACAAPLRGKKGAHYEGGMRVPLIAAWAKAKSTHRHQKRLPIPAGRIQNQQAAVFDLFPTILALADAAPPADHIVDGRRLDTLLSGQRDRGRNETFLMHYPHSPHRSNYFTCYRDGDWKVIYHYFPSKASKGSHYQLYNLAKDPFESTNLAKAEPARLRTMMQGLIASMKKHNALFPVDNKNGQAPLTPKLPLLRFMKHCPQCGIRLEYHRDSCPSCDWSLAVNPSARVHEVENEPADASDEPVVAIARFLNAAEAGFFAHTLLNSEEIPASLRAEDDFDAVSGFWTARYLLMVPERMVDAATKALQSVVKRSETEDFLDSAGDPNELTHFGSESVNVTRFAEDPERYPADETSTIKWGPVMLTLAAGSLALWGLRELQRPPRVEAGPKHGALWDDLSEPSKPWVQQLEGDRRRELHFDRQRNRAVIREYTGNRKTAEREFAVPAEAVPAE
eukprot:g8401.t1